MTMTFEQLSQRQHQLVARAAAQRVELAEIHANLGEPLAWLQAGLTAARTIRAHPQIAFVSALAVFLTLGGHISKARSWLARALAIFNLYRMLAARFLKR